MNPTKQSMGRLVGRQDWASLCGADWFLATATATSRLEKAGQVPALQILAVLRLVH